MQRELFYNSSPQSQTSTFATYNYVSITWDCILRPTDRESPAQQVLITWRWRKQTKASESRYMMISWTQISVSFILRNLKEITFHNKNFSFKILMQNSLHCQQTYCFEGCIPWWLEWPCSNRRVTGSILLSDITSHTGQKHLHGISARQWLLGWLAITN